jgi:hypothetical protein
MSRLGLRVMASVLWRELSLWGSVGWIFCFVLLFVLFLDFDLLFPLCLLLFCRTGGYLAARACMGSLALPFPAGLGCARVVSTNLFM